MTKTVHALFDGNVFEPKEPLDLAPNTTWLLLVSDEVMKATADHSPHPLEVIGALATDMGPSDLSEHFDGYTRRRLEAENG